MQGLAPGHSQQLQGAAAAPLQLTQQSLEDKETRLAAKLAEISTLCSGNPSLLDAAAARLDGFLPGLRSLSVQLQQEEVTGSQHPATLQAEPLQQLEPDRSFTLKRGEKAMYGGRSKAQRKRARIAAAEPAAAAVPPAIVEPFKAPARRAVPSKRMTVAAALAARSTKENTVPAASMAPLQHAAPHAARPPVMWQGQANALHATACTAPAAMPGSNGYAAVSTHWTATTAGAAGSAQRSPLHDLQLGSAAVTVQPSVPCGTAAPSACMATALAVLPGAGTAAGTALGVAAGPHKAAMASVPLRGDDLLSLAKTLL